MNDQGIPLGSLIGYDSKFTEGRIGEIEKQVMEREGVTFENFKLKTMSECSAKGARGEAKAAKRR